VTGALFLVVAINAGSVITPVDYPVGQALNRAVELQLRTAETRPLHRAWHLPVARETPRSPRPTGSFRFQLESADK